MYYPLSLNNKIMINACKSFFFLHQGLFAGSVQQEKSPDVAKNNITGCVETQWKFAKQDVCCKRRVVWENHSSNPSHRWLDGTLWSGNFHTVWQAWLAVTYCFLSKMFMFDQFNNNKLFSLWLLLCNVTLQHLTQVFFITTTILFSLSFSQGKTVTIELGYMQ